MSAASTLAGSLLLSVLTVGIGTKIGDMEQGVEISKCFKIDDWNTKTLGDDIDLVDRDANGCCAEGYVPGVTLYKKYMGAQVVCGVNDDGTISNPTYSNSNGVKSCDYGKCYVMNIADRIVCKNDEVPLLSGCCGTKGARTFADTCLAYDYTITTYTAGANISPEYCLTYHKNYGSMEYPGTDDKSDDVKDGKLQVDNFYTFAACAKGGGGGGGSEPGEDASAAFSLQAFGLVTLLVAALAQYQ